MARLTSKAVEAARAAQERREVPDEYLRGLYLIVQPTGNKTWAVRYRLGGRSHKHTIGGYPAFDLKQARDSAAKILRAVAEGRPPEHRVAGTVEDAVAQFLERHCKGYRQRTRKEAERLLRLYVVNNWGRRRLHEVQRADIRAMLAGIEAPIAANRVHSITRRLFGWAVENDLIATSPVTGIKRLHKEKSRDRVLTDDELRAVWQAADQIGYPLGPIVQLLILTGQRRSEVAEMGWAELDLEAGTWTLPRERVKNDRQHAVPLSRQAVAIIGSLPRISEQYAFSTNGTSPYQCFRSRALAPKIAAWTLHDLRRTAASGMARLGIGLAVIEKVLNHVSGSFAGIVGVYQRHEFADEKRAALQQWADYVERLVQR